MLNRTVLGVSAIAIAIAVMFLSLRFCSGGDSEEKKPPPAPATLVDTDLMVRPAGADAVGFVLSKETKVEVSVAVPGAPRFFDTYLMSEADWNAVKIPGGLPPFTIQNTAASSLEGNVPAGSWRVVVHDAHDGRGMSVHVRVIQNPQR
jgi:hypothetical protein